MNKNRVSAFFCYLTLFNLYCVHEFYFFVLTLLSPYLVSTFPQMFIALSL